MSGLDRAGSNGEGRGALEARGVLSLFERAERRVVSVFFSNL